MYGDMYLVRFATRLSIIISYALIVHFCPKGTLFTEHPWLKLGARPDHYRLMGNRSESLQKFKIIQFSNSVQSPTPFGSPLPQILYGPQTPCDGYNKNFCNEET